MSLKNPDYSLYLVTDSTPAVLGEKDLVDVVEAACRGGATVVQYREKHQDTAVLVQTAKKLHAVTQRYNVPLLVNDRVDVAIAVGCEGVHIGQDDLDFTTARRLLGPDAIIGVTVSNPEEAVKACNDGASYLGIGTVFSTPTKTNSKAIVGISGVRSILTALAALPSPQRDIPTVAIGGINAFNLSRVLFQGWVPGELGVHASKQLDGVAVVSAIVASHDAEVAAKKLREVISTPPRFAFGMQWNDRGTVLRQIPETLRKLAHGKPLSHNMTNLVVQNFAANVALAVGASPIMANYAREAEDLCKAKAALVINMGSVTPEGVENYVEALQAYNTYGGPVVFDPVGAGATEVRKQAVKTILSAGFVDVIKGNEGEIRTVYGEENVEQKGVDAGVSTLDEKQKASMVKELARRERNVVIMTGEVDIVSDGKTTLVLRNGHKYLSQITGSGCVVGTVISACLAVGPLDRLTAVVAALLLYEIAAEIAAEREDVKGPGSFVPALIDELHRITGQIANGDFKWLERAKVEEAQLVK